MKTKGVTYSGSYLRSSRQRNTVAKVPKKTLDILFHALLKNIFLPRRSFCRVVKASHLEQIFAMLDKKPQAVRRSSVSPDEGNEIMDEYKDSLAIGAGLLAAGRR